MTKSIDDVFDLVTEQGATVTAIKSDVSELKTDMKDARDRLKGVETIVEERTGHAAAATPPLQSPSIAAPAKSSKMSIKILQTYLPWILIGLAAIGSWMAATNGDGANEQQIERAAEKAEDTQKDVERLLKLLESVAEHPPASFDPNVSDNSETAPD